MEASRNEIYQDLIRELRTEENIGTVAYYIWEDDGRLNGDEIIGTPIGCMLRRDYQWHLAEQMVEANAHVDATIYWWAILEEEVNEKQVII